MRRALPEEGDVGGRSGIIAASVASLVWLLVGFGAAAADDPIEMDVMVCHISQQPGEVDPRAKRLDAKLRGEFRYESLRVLSQERLAMELNDLERVALPDGHELQLRVLSVSDRGALVAVTVEGSVQTDMQIPNGHLVAIGAGRHEDGKLVISLEPHF
jgi:hypothetical protein